MPVGSAKNARVRGPIGNILQGWCPGRALTQAAWQGLLSAVPMLGACGPDAACMAALQRQIRAAGLGKAEPLGRGWLQLGAAAWRHPALLPLRSHLAECMLGTLQHGQWKADMCDIRVLIAYGPHDQPPHLDGLHPEMGEHQRFAVLVLTPGEQGTFYLSPTSAVGAAFTDRREAHYTAFRRANAQLRSGDRLTRLAESQLMHPTEIAVYRTLLGLRSEHFQPVVARDGHAPLLRLDWPHFGPGCRAAEGGQGGVARVVLFAPFLAVDTGRALYEVDEQFYPIEKFTALAGECADSRASAEYWEARSLSRSPFVCGKAKK